ncbi:unnamed protein product [Arabidopsis thaliana]|uniref:(thale cress) hypothetical protein n=1 Tax=Arabidopsis thaliana TaxID=3702 RepID=A0A7G2FAR0_ARATH|nr:unnamed protein product [Arabidopsis thaliana]
MPLIPFPLRLIAFGEEPRGERVNVYQKMKTLCGIFNALDDGERQYLSRSLFARLLEFPNNPACSRSSPDYPVIRVITMLKRMIVSDPGMRIRCACLAIVDGFLVPTSHYPKIVKAHAKMAAPSIQDGPLIDETIESDSKGAEDDVEVAPRESVPFKLGNAKELDEKCSIMLLSINFVNRYHIIDAKPSKNLGGVRTKHHRPIHEEGRSSGAVSVDAISRMLDAKLETQGKTMISTLTDWFAKNTFIEGEHSKDPDCGINRPKEPAPASNVGASNSDDLGCNCGNDEFAFNTLRPNSRSHCRERTSNLEASVDEILSFYTNKVSSGVNCKEAELFQFPMDEDSRYEGDVVDNLQVANNVTDEVVPPLYSGPEDKSEVANHNSVQDDLPPEGDVNDEGDVTIVVNPPPHTHVVVEDNAEVANHNFVQDDLPPEGDVNDKGDVNESFYPSREITLDIYVLEKTTLA